MKVIRPWGTTVPQTPPLRGNSSSDSISSSINQNRKEKGRLLKLTNHITKSNDAAAVSRRIELQGSSRSTREFSLRAPKEPFSGNLRI